MKTYLIILMLLSGFLPLHAQETPDTSNVADDENLEELFDEFTSFLDSLMSPRSYLVVSVGVGHGNYNFRRENEDVLKAVRRINYSPSLSYYHRSGLGLNGTAYLMHQKDGIKGYQWSLTPSFDYIKNKRFVTGLTYTRFFTRDSLDFYTSPLENEFFAYFTYRGGNYKPTVSMSYGWGNREAYAQRKELIDGLRLRRIGIIRTSSNESISDFAINASLRRDFYWFGWIDKLDRFRFTPQLMFSAGTQRFGFNQTSNYYAVMPRTDGSVLYRSEDTYLDDYRKFQPLALSLFFRTEYSIGKFFLQPQITLDYYIPDSENPMSIFYNATAGFAF